MIHPYQFSVVKEYKHTLYGDIKEKGIPHTTTYDPPLPTSVVKEEIIEPNEEYDKRDKKVRNTVKKEENYGKGYLDKKINFRKYDPTLGGNGAPSHLYDPPLPVSVVNEKYTYKQDKEKDLYGTDIRKEVRTGKDVGKSPIYDPPLPTTMLEIKSTRGKHSTEKPVALMEWLLKYYSKEGDTSIRSNYG
jgi:DNA modification methylase